MRLYWYETHTEYYPYTRTLLHLYTIRYVTMDISVTIRSSSRVSPVDVVEGVDARHTSDDARTRTRPTHLRTYLRAYLRNEANAPHDIIHHDAAGPAPPERGLGGVLPRIRV